jgi:hypothetical protein
MYTDPFGLCKEKDEVCKKRESVEHTNGTTDPGLLDPTALAGGVAGAGVKLLGKAAVAVGEKVLFEGGKAALKEALATGIEGVNSGQASAIGHALKEGSVDAIRVVTGENGLVTYSTRAGRYGYQTLVRIYDGAGGLKGMAQAAWDDAGKFVHGEVWK